METTRDKLISTTMRLVERQGYRATGINQLIRESGAAKGSLYYFFPNGKQEMVRVAIERAAAGIAGNIATFLATHDDPRTALPAFIRELAEHVDRLGYSGGGPITAVALEAASTDDPLRLACRDAYRSWAALFADKLRPAFGPRADRLAVVALAAIEGGIVLSRSERSPRPLLDVADEIEALLSAGG